MSKGFALSSGYDYDERHYRFARSSSFAEPMDKLSVRWSWLKIICVGVTSIAVLLLTLFIVTA